MPLRFSRRFRLGPLRLNASKTGLSWSIGRRGAWLTTGHGRQRVSVGLPNSGIGWYRQRPLPRPTSTPATFLRSLALIFIVLAVASALLWH